MWTHSLFSVGLVTASRTLRHADFLAARGHPRISTLQQGGSFLRQRSTRQPMLSSMYATTAEYASRPLALWI